jgi:hypothetical protein
MTQNPVPDAPQPETKGVPQGSMTDPAVQRQDGGNPNAESADDNRRADRDDPDEGGSGV